MSVYQLGREIWTEVQEFRLGLTEGLANHVHGAHLESLLKVSAGQWNTLFNFSLALTAKSVFCCVTKVYSQSPSSIDIASLNGCIHSHLQRWQ